MLDKITERISPVTIAHQRLFSPKIRGNKNANAIWNIKVLHKEIIADIAPLFSAVKKLEE